MRARGLWLGCALLLVLGATAPARAADPRLFEAGLQDFFAKRYEQAAGKLYTFLEATPPTEENYAWAQLFLGRSFNALGLHHAAAYYLAKVSRERSNPEAVPKALEELRLLVDQPHDEVMVDEQIFGALDLGSLQGSAGDFANYEQGLMDLRTGYERWARAHFNRLDEGGADASRAKFAVLVHRLKSVREVPDEMIEDFLQLSRAPKLSLETRNEGRLAVARLRFERKDYEGALAAYEQVELPPLDPGRATLYLEEAWTRYHLGQIRDAMGLLVTLDAPSFRDAFLPDKYILRALVYRDLCHYLPAKRAARELTRHYADSLEAVRERDDLTHDARLRAAAESHGATAKAARFLRTLDLERERLSRFTGSFGGKLTGHLSKLYDLARGEAERVHDERLKDSIRVEADKLVRAAEQVRLVDYEVGLKLYERIKKGVKHPLPAEEAALAPDQVAFRFDGEYWNDELRTYRVSLKSRCVEEGQR